MPKPSPLLYGRETGTPLDLITERLFFVWPLSKRQIEWLNTVIYEDRLFLINYWSLTHTFFGFLWGLAFPSPSPLPFILFHTLFEIWELWAGGYLGSGSGTLTIQEMVDVVMDTLFGVAGFYIGRSIWSRLIFDDNPL